MTAQTPAQFLRRVRAVSDADLAREVGALARRRAELAAVGETKELAAALAHLASKRLLASNTLRHANPADRLAWDDANRWVSERLVGGAGPWTAESLAELNRRLGGGDVRTGAIFTGDDEYLAPELVREELVTLAAHLAERRGLAGAVVTYIALVTIHPFVNANGRTARLAADALLLEEGFLPLCFLSSIQSHVAQTMRGPIRDPLPAIRRVVAAVEESYTTVLRRISSPS